MGRERRAHDGGDHEKSVVTDARSNAMEMRDRRARWYKAFIRRVEPSGSLSS
jgi:hypothetical protein